MESVLANVWLEVALLFLLSLQLRTQGMQITSSGPQTIQQPQGGTVELGCTYTPGAQDTGELDIEWSNVSPDMTQKDNLILSYTGGQLHIHDTRLSDRFKFLADPKQGDASISFSAVKVSDTGTYQCKVKKTPGVDMRKVTVVVLATPSVPKCWVEGSEEKGGPVSLRCKSYQGSMPLTYAWTRESGGAMPSTATQDAQSGQLLIKNHTESNVGSYLCVAKNPVGQAQCKYYLNAYNPTNKAGVIAGAVIGALLLLILLLLLIWLLIICCCKKRKQKEVAHEIREDAPAPESRPVSRQSSSRSMMGYRTHQGMQYSSVPGRLPSAAGSGSIYTGNRNGSTVGGGALIRNGSTVGGDKSVSLKYDPKYGYAV